ncbi:MAG: cytochrome [Cyanobacteriota bacterium]|jgi:cytochrome c6
MFNAMTKPFLRAVFCCLLFFTTLLMTGENPALAADINHGKQLFGGNCAACHTGGLNAVVKEKTLQKDALETYGKNSVDAIVAQITNGAGAMPRFSSLSQTDKEDIAEYVLAQAENGWK